MTELTLIVGHIYRDKARRVFRQIRQVEDGRVYFETLGRIDSDWLMEPEATFRAMVVEDVGPVMTAEAMGVSP